MSVHLLSEQFATAIEQISSEVEIYIGFSGGLDSHVLLHLCATYKNHYKITAVYIHHGLQPEAECWGQHCQAIAHDLGLKFLLMRVNALPEHGQSPEEAARNARYDAFKTLLQAGDVLMLAQHREDQLETVLLQLFRGSGLRGLSGMPEFIDFGKGILLRPLLSAPKLSLLDYAETMQLNWIEDPSNQCNDYDRNYLRNALIPLIKTRWPACDITVARSAHHCAEAQGLLTELAEQLFATLFNPVDRTLSIDKLDIYSMSQQRLIIREWFQALGLKMPSQAFMRRIFQEVINAHPQRDPILSAQGYSVRRYRQRLYCLSSINGTYVPQNAHWPVDQSFLPATNGQVLQVVDCSAGILKSQWHNAEITVKYRSGGEKMRLPGRQGRHELKKLFQEAGIPPWQRAQIPLIYMNNQLAAVGEYWISADFYVTEPDRCISFVLLNGSGIEV